MPLFPPQDYRKTAFTHRRGLRADQPLASDVLEGTLYYVTDEGVMERSDGTNWESVEGTGGISNINISAGTTSQNLSNLVFSNSNGVSFGLNASTITAIHNGITSQSNQIYSAFINTIAGNLTGGVSSATVNATSVPYVGLGEISLGFIGNSLAISNLRKEASAANGAFTFNTIHFSNSNNVSFSTTAGPAIVASVTVASTQASIRISAGTTSILSSGFTFSNSNNISFGIDNGTITARSEINISFATGSINITRLVFTNSNGVTFGLAGAGITAAVSSLTFSDAVTSLTLSQLAFTNLNGVTLSLSTTTGGSATLVGSHNALTSQSAQVASASNGSFAFQTIAFSDANNVTFGTSAGSIITASVAAGGGLTNINVSAGTTSNNLSNIVFSNSNGVSFGLNGSTITGSVAAGGGGGITMSHWPPFPIGLAFSTNNTGTSGATGGSTQFTGSFYVAPFLLVHPISFSKIAGVFSHATVAATGSISILRQLGIYSLNGGSALSLVSSFMFRHEISQNSITAQSHRFYWGTNSTSNSSSSGGNISTIYSGPREYPLYDATSGSLAASQYWMVVNQINRSTVANIYPASSVMRISESLTTQAGQLGTNNTNGLQFPLLGVFSSTTNTNVLTAQFMPNSIHTSAITRTGGTSQWQFPFVKMIATL